MIVALIAFSVGVQFGRFDIWPLPWWSTLGEDRQAAWGGTFGTWAAAIVTFAAVIVALFSPKWEVERRRMRMQFTVWNSLIALFDIGAEIRSMRQKTQDGLVGSIEIYDKITGPLSDECEFRLVRLRDYICSQNDLDPGIALDIERAEKHIRSLVDRIEWFRQMTFDGQLKSEAKVFLEIDTLVDFIGAMSSRV